jgi:hypothetical protein
MLYNFYGCNLRMPFAGKDCQGKYSSLLGTFLNYVCKFIYNIGL